MVQADKFLSFSPTNKFAQRTFTQRLWILPLLVFICTECALLLVNAVLPLRGVWFYDSLIARFGTWTLLPTQLLFPHFQTVLGQARGSMPLSPAMTWKETFLLFGAFTLLFALYLVAVYVLPKRVSRRFILCSTFLLGVTLTFCPAIASQDIFSYIAYARMVALYHLNPFANLPAAIHTDPIYAFVYWSQQPSLYGPTWILITSGIQWLASVCGFSSLPTIVLLLRLFSLAMHLSSTLLIWSILGHFGHIQSKESMLSKQVNTQRVRRVLATLAFAWNPALLFDACINAHSDTTVLFLLLLSIWLLLPRSQTTRYASFLAVAVFAAAICLKANFLLLLPGLFLFLLAQRTQLSLLKRIRSIVGFAVVGLVVAFLLYAPFLQHAQILHLLLANPNTAHDANSLYEVVVRLYAAHSNIRIPPSITPNGIAIENISHTVSTLLFLLVYVALCIRTLLLPRTIDTVPALVRWMALLWFLYCLLGAPWFWPWYLITFFGLFALVEGDMDARVPSNAALRFLHMPLVVRGLAYTMLSVYCFYTWALDKNVVPFLFPVQWLYLRGLWLWFLPLFLLSFFLFLHRRQSKRSLLTTSKVELPSA